MRFQYGGEEFMRIIPSTTIDVAIELAENIPSNQAEQRSIKHEYL